MQKSLQQKLAATWLIVTLITCCLSLLPWFGVALMSLISFDIGFATAVITFIILIWSYPLFLIIVEGLSLYFYFKRKYCLSIIVGTIPLVPILFTWIYIFHLNIRFWWPY